MFSFFSGVFPPALLMFCFRRQPPYRRFYVQFIDNVNYVPTVQSMQCSVYIDMYVQPNKLMWSSELCVIERSAITRVSGVY